MSKYIITGEDTNGVFGADVYYTAEGEDWRTHDRAKAFELTRKPQAKMLLNDIKRRDNNIKYNWVIKEA